MCPSYNGLLSSTKEINTILKKYFGEGLNAPYKAKQGYLERVNAIPYIRVTNSTLPKGCMMYPN